MHLLKSVLDPTGIQVSVLPEPDNKALQFGREYGNRGQCNPTYFTVGNLIKTLVHLRDIEGLSATEIEKKYAFVTAGGCGPCRMGMYATEYRKALRDSGFPNFRVLIFTRSGDVEDVLMEGLGMDTKTLIKFFAMIEIGDILNTIQLRLRPFEVNKGEVDSTVERARKLIANSMVSQKGFLSSILQARKLINSININNKIKKPKVHIMGEFWAKTTDGEGNYNLFRFIENEGGIIANETVTDWLLHQVWRAKWMDARKRKHFWQLKNYFQLSILELILKTVFKVFTYVLGVSIKLSNHQKLAQESKSYFDLHVDGGEDHMEVAHHIHIAKHSLADMIISVKPFTCLSSSAVSDGVQAKVCEDYPNIEFISVETNGDSAANFYSRIQMGLQKVLQEYH